MAVLTKTAQAGYGPFVDFLELRPGEGPRPIVSLSDELLDLYCNVTNSYLPFDPYLGGQLERREIRIFARELFLWSAHITHCRLDANDIAPLIGLYLPLQDVGPSVYGEAKESMRQDLIDTATFLAVQAVAVARAENTLVIDGM